MYKNHKYDCVIQKNTFYFSSPDFEQNYEANTINAIKVLLLDLQRIIEHNSCNEKIFIDFLHENEYGLDAILCLNGIAKETIQRIITITRIVNDNSLNKLLLADKWIPEDEFNSGERDLKEWTKNKLQTLVLSNKYFCEGLVNLFFKGASNPFLARTLPLFELSKLNFSKINFDKTAMIDTIIRYCQKGSYNAKKENNAEIVIENILDELGITFEKGDLPKLEENAPSSKRTMDFIIPNKEKPTIIIESSFLSTTSSGQGDKAKTEIEISKLIKKYYPKAKFWGFVDGIGWYVRKKDLARMVEAYNDVFTFAKEEIKRFEKQVKEAVK